MWIIWSKRRSLLVLSGTLVAATVGNELSSDTTISTTTQRIILALCVANVVVEQAIFVDPNWARTLSTTRGSLSLTFGTNALALAALFTSLSSNVIATALIGLKAWYALLLYRLHDGRGL